MGSTLKRLRLRQSKPGRRGQAIGTEQPFSILSSDRQLRRERERHDRICCDLKCGAASFLTIWWLFSCQSASREAVGEAVESSCVDCRKVVVDCGVAARQSGEHGFKLVVGFRCSWLVRSPQMQRKKA